MDSVLAEYFPVTSNEKKIQELIFLQCFYEWVMSGWILDFSLDSVLNKVFCYIAGAYTFNNVQLACFIAQIIRKIFLGQQKITDKDTRMRSAEKCCLEFYGWH